MEGSVGCHDCGRPYGNEHGFPDLLIPNHVWRQISPTGDEGGLLCPSCIVKRVAALDVNGTFAIPAAFMSGPLKSVDPDVMGTMLLVENLREQGHGWRCPKCHEFRELLPASGEPVTLSASGASAGS